MSKEKGCKCCKQIWYVDMLDKKWKLCPNCYEYCKPLFDDLKIKDKQIADLETKLAEAQKTIEIQKMSNNALQEENLDYRYDITDTAYEQAKYMAESWEEDYQQEITELEQQLAEKDKEIDGRDKRIDRLEEDYYQETRQLEWVNEQLTEVKKQLVNEKEELKQQLEEKEKNALALFSALYYILEEQDPENVSSRIDYLTKQNNGAISDFYKEHKVLKQKLEEKDKEIEYQESMKILAVENQNKKAIEQLEKVKEIINKNYFYNLSNDSCTFDKLEVDFQINNQIKQLREMK